MSDETKNGLETITEGLESLSEEEKTELFNRLTKAVNITKSNFLEEQREKVLYKRYLQESNALNLNGLNGTQRVKRIDSIKRKYRAQGLEVW